jgi:hypothetical protein
MKRSNLIALEPMMLFAVPLMYISTPDPVGGVEPAAVTLILATVNPLA